MGTKILYEQSQPIAGEEISVGQMSSEYFVLCMSRAFGEFPVTLTKDHIERLEGMKACWAQTSLNPYAQLISQVKRLGSVKVWASYEDKKHQDDTYLSTDSRSEP
jgi:hypothetical protein